VRPLLPDLQEHLFPSEAFRGFVPFGIFEGDCRAAPSSASTITFILQVDRSSNGRAWEGT
jgi:hypothetical protein